MIFKLTNVRDKNINLNNFQKILLELIYNYRKAQLVYIAAKLSIADILSDGPKDVNF